MNVNISGLEDMTRAIDRVQRLVDDLRVEASSITAAARGLGMEINQSADGPAD